MKIIKFTLALSFTALALLSTIVTAQEVPIPDIPVTGEQTGDGFETDFMKWQQDEILRRMLLDQMDAALAAAAAEAGRQAAAQAAAAAAAAEEQSRRRRMECGSRRASIEGSRGGCSVGAHRNNTAAIASCPVESGVEVNVGGVIGGVSVTTSPRTICMDNAAAQLGERIATCDAMAAEALTQLPLYCYE